MVLLYLVTELAPFVFSSAVVVVRGACGIEGCLQGYDVVFRSTHECVVLVCLEIVTLGVSLLQLWQSEENQRRILIHLEVEEHSWLIVHLLGSIQLVLQIPDTFFLNQPFMSSQQKFVGKVGMWTLTRYLNGYFAH